MGQDVKPFESSEVTRQISPLVLVGCTIAGALASFAWLAISPSVLPFMILWPLLLITVGVGSTLRRGGTLRVDGEGVRWRGRVVIPHDEIVHVGREGEAVTVRTESFWRSVSRFYAPNESVARELVAALGDPDARPAVTLRLASPTTLRGGGVFAALLAAPVAMLLTPLVTVSLGHSTLWHFALAAIGALSVAFALMPMRVSLGADGIHIQWLTRSRWIRWIDVADAHRLPESDVLVLKLKRGEEVRVPAEEAFALTDADASEDLLARIKRAMQAAHEARGHAVATALARGDETTRDWVARLRSLFKGDTTGYRSAAVSVDEVADALRDRGADESLRIAAAIAYSPAGGAEVVRKEAETVASTHVRVVLDAAADGDEEAIERAVEEHARSTAGE